MERPSSPPLSPRSVARSPGLQRSATSTPPIPSPASAWTQGLRSTAPDLDEDAWSEHLKDAKRNLQQLDMLLGAHDKVLALLAKTASAAIATGKELSLLYRYNIIFNQFKFLDGFNPVTFDPTLSFPHLLLLTL